ncbi:MAG: helix-turn-helix transcriptional regulator [Hyphomicrobiaceae bacterium]|nr:helix-turn-helix transcriptional regulator [Hyphomicrobiaceae bacterium]
MNELDQHIGRQIQTRRQILDLTIKEVAEQLQVSVAEFDRYEKGELRIFARQLVRLSDLLQVPIRYFFEGFAETQHTEATAEQTAQLLAAFRSIKSLDVRTYLIELSTAIAASNADQYPASSLH